MYLGKRLALFLCVWLITSVNAFVLGQVQCSKTCCKPTNRQVHLPYFDSANCYQYTNNGTSCRGCCGKWSASQGYCTTYNCDPNQVCLSAGTTYQYQIGISLGADCTLEGEFNEKAQGECGQLDSTKHNEPLCTCGPEVSNAKVC